MAFNHLRDHTNVRLSGKCQKFGIFLIMHFSPLAMEWLKPPPPPVYATGYHHVGSVYFAYMAAMIVFDSFKFKTYSPVFWCELYAWIAYDKKSEVGSLKTFLASRASSRIHFKVLSFGLEYQVLGLGLEPQVLENCPVLGSRTAVFFELLKFCRSPKKNFWRPFFLWIAWKSFWRPLFWKTLAPVLLVLGLGLKHSCPWPREDLSWKGMSLALASGFFVSLALASNLVSSTPPLQKMLYERRSNEKSTVYWSNEVNLSLCLVIVFIFCNQLKYSVVGRSTTSLQRNINFRHFSF